MAVPMTNVYATSLMVIRSRIDESVGVIKKRQALALALATTNKATIDRVAAETSPLNSPHSTLDGHEGPRHGIKLSAILGALGCFVLLIMSNLTTFKTRKITHLESAASFFHGLSLWDPCFQISETLSRRCAWDT
jgi:hypothetical protein